MKYELIVDGRVVEIFDTCQEAMDYGNQYYSEGYTVK